MAASSSNAELGCCGIAELITIPFQLANRRRPLALRIEPLTFGNTAETGFCPTTAKRTHEMPPLSPFRLSQ